VSFSREEIDALLGVLDYYVPDLHAEILRTDDDELRDRLRAHEALLLGVRERLRESRERVPDRERDELLSL
jgi:hypothetical protein